MIDRRHPFPRRQARLKPTRARAETTSSASDDGSGATAGATVSVVIEPSRKPCEPLVERGRRWNSVIVFDGDSIQRVRHPRGDVGSDVYVSPTENVLLTDAGTEFS